VKIEGILKQSNEHYLAIVPLLDLREVGRSKEELFNKLTNRIAQSLNELSKYDKEIGEIKIIELNDSGFELNFSNTKLIYAILLKRLRQIEKISQEKVSKSARMERGSYKQYEEAKREPSVSKFNDLIEAIGYEWTLNIKRKPKK
jgi:DNA-binding XRE family transcriptional regulator